MEGTTLVLNHTTALFPALSFDSSKVIDIFNSTIPLKICDRLQVVNVCGPALVQDRTCKFYVISVYIHPDNRNGDMEALLRAWRFLDKKSEYTFLAGDFNGIDKHDLAGACRNSIWFLILGGILQPL